MTLTGSVNGCPGPDGIGHQCEHITDSVSKRRAAGRDLGGYRAKFTDSQVRSARRLIDGGQTGTQVAKDLGMSRATLYRRMAEI